MRLYGLIGTGIQDSGSPALFKAAYGGRFRYDLLDGPDFAPLFEKFKKEYQAVNVTAPFKEQAMAKADQCTEAASLCGAANMLIKQPDGRILADNSDFEGVTMSIMSAYAIADEDLDVSDEDAFTDYLADKTALVVGCGGAGKAAAAAAVTLGYGTTILMNRDRNRAEELNRHIRKFYDDLGKDELTVMDISDFTAAFRQADIVIYTIPEAIDAIKAEGFAGAVTDSGCGKSKIVFEANYKTPCLEFLKDRCNYLSGFNWLLNQAILSYEVFTASEPDEEAMKKILR